MATITINGRAVEADVGAPLVGPRQYIAGYSQITMLGNGGYHCDFYFNATDQELEFINPIAYCGP